MPELRTALNAEKIGPIWMFPNSFYHSFVVKMTFIHSLNG